MTIPATKAAVLAVTILLPLPLLGGCAYPAYRYVSAPCGTASAVPVPQAQATPGQSAPSATGPTQSCMIAVPYYSASYAGYPAGYGADYPGYDASGGLYAPGDYWSYGFDPFLGIGFGGYYGGYHHHEYWGHGGWGHGFHSGYGGLHGGFHGGFGGGFHGAGGGHGR